MFERMKAEERAKADGAKRGRAGERARLRELLPELERTQKQLAVALAKVAELEGAAAARDQAEPAGELAPKDLAALRRGVAASDPPPARNNREPMRPLAPTTSPCRPFTAIA